MSLLKNLKTDATIADETDRVGSGGPLDSGLHTATIKLAYLTKSAGGAVGLVLNAANQTGREIRQTLWMTSGTAKGGKNYYEKDGEKHYLPGFVLANALSLLTVGKDIADCDTETKVVNVYSPEAKAEVPTKVEMITELLGQEITIGLIKQTVDKTVKDEATGTYRPTGETREENEIDKFFRARDLMTTAEIRAQAETAAFAAIWEAKWKGEVRNKAKGGTGVAGAPGAPKGAAPGTAKPKSSLFS
jgi:hypothetical protein